MSPRPASILGTRKVLMASTAGASGIRKFRIRPRTNHMSFSSRSSSSAQVHSMFRRIPRYRKDVPAGRALMWEVPSTPGRQPTLAGSSEDTNLVFFQLILKECAPKNERTHSWRARIPSSESATMAVSSAYPIDARRGPSAKATPCPSSKQMSSRPQCRASRTRMKIRGASGSPWRTHDSTSKASVGPSRVRTRLLLPHSEEHT